MTRDRVYDAILTLWEQHQRPPLQKEVEHEVGICHGNAGRAIRHLKDDGRLRDVTVLIPATLNFSVRES